MLDHESAIEALGLDLDYATFGDLIQRLAAWESADPDDPEGGVVPAVMQSMLGLSATITVPDGGNMASPVRGPYQFRDLTPSNTVALLALIDYTHCQLAGVLEAIAYEEGLYSDTLAEALRAHTEASTALTQAIDQLAPQR